MNTPSLSREELIARLGTRQPGRRGFGGTSDPLEAAEVRAATRGDHDLNPGETPPSAALRPAAVLVPLIDRADGMTVLLTQRTAHLSAHAGQISFPGGRIEEADADEDGAELGLELAPELELLLPLEQAARPAASAATSRICWRTLRATIQLFSNFWGQPAT